MRKVLFLLLIVSLSIAIQADIFDINRSLGKGINLGNVFEAPDFGVWGEKYDTNHIAIIAQKGFQTVRVPIRWSPAKRTAIDAPFTIADTFFNVVDEAISCALSHKLKVIINVHHYDSLFKNPEKEWDRFKAMWQQIAVRYKDYSDSLVFEILNEPNTNLTAEKWNVLLNETFPVIRESNKTRPVIIGVADWGGIGALNKLVLPQDSNIILTVHYYLPFNFTHQGASWVEGADKWLETKWKGTSFEKKAVIDDIEYIRAYSEKNKVPVFIGEFGAIHLADIESRARWSSYCARLFEKYDFSWAYWAFGAGFNVYDQVGKKWIDTLADALLSTDTTILALNNDEPLGTESIKNGTFADDSNWDLNLNSTNAQATGTVANNEYSVAVINPDTANWNIQLVQEKIALKAGHSYLLLFDVYADSEREIAVAVDRCPPPDYVWMEYASKWGFSVAKEKKTVSIPFTMAVDDSIARVTFYLGYYKSENAITTIHISNVHLYDQGSNAPVNYQPIHHKNSALSFTTKTIGKTITIAFEKRVTEPVSIVIYNLSGKVFYKANKVVVGNEKVLAIPMESRSSSPMILQVKSSMFNGCTFIGNVK